MEKHNHVFRDNITNFVSHRRKHEYYGRKKVRNIRILYILACVAWTILIFSIGLYETKLGGFIILSIPYFVFFSGYYEANLLTPEVEDDNFQSNYLSIGLLIVLPLLTFINGSFKGNRNKFVAIMILALILTMLSLIDVWVPEQYISYVRHVKSIFQTLSIILLIYALYMFYLESGFLTEHNKNPSDDKVTALSKEESIIAIDAAIL